MTTVTFSVSTWRQPVPGSVSPERDALLDRITTRVLAPTPLRPAIGIDGGSAAGKTLLGHELATRLAAAARPVLRASLDDFKRPWAERFVVDRESPEGLYRNAFDYPVLRRLLLEPFRRSAVRDRAWAGSKAEHLMRTRYLPSEDLYRAEADPVRLADLVIDNSDHTRPRLLREN